MNLILWIATATGIILISTYIKTGNPIVASYLSAIVVIGVFLMLLLKGYLFGKKYTIQPSKNLTQPEKDFIEKHKLLFEIIARTFWFSLVIGGMVLIVVPCIKDLPLIMKNDYSVVTGEVIEYYVENGDRKGVRIKEGNTQNIIEIQVNYKEIKTGEKYTIKYLPNIGVGEVVIDWDGGNNER